MGVWEGCFLITYPVPSGGWGPFVELPGPAKGRAGSGPRVRGSSWAILSSSRHPISRLPSVRPVPYPHASLGVRGCEAGLPRGRVTTAPHLPAPVGAGGPRVPLSVPFPPSISEGRSISNPLPSRSLLILYVRLRAVGTLPPDASSCHHAGGLGTSGVPGCWKSC